MPARPELPGEVKDPSADGAPTELNEIARLEADIALRRARVGASFEELRRRVHAATSWRHWAASHPVGWIGVGAAMGFVIGWWRAADLTQSHDSRERSFASRRGLRQRRAPLGRDWARSRLSS